MKLHHINCGTMNPYGSRLLTGEGGWFDPAELVTHCLLIETDKGLILVDTGFGRDEVKNPDVLGSVLRFMMRPKLDPSETALNQVRDLGYDFEDVKHIILTHLDVDHAGGLKDFPNAKIHLLKEELDTIDSPSLMDKLRYFDHQWDHDPQWVPESTESDSWYGFDSTEVLEDFPGRYRIVSLPGHSPGHAGVAVEDDNGWILHCGDAYFKRGEIYTEASAQPLGLTLQQKILASSEQKRIQTQKKLRQLTTDYGDEIKLFCSHDIKELGSFN